MQLIQQTALGAVPGGTPVLLPGANVTVKIGGTETLATLYDAAGDPQANPITADSNGMYAFRAADGEYDITVEYGAYAGSASVSLADPSVIAAAVVQCEQARDAAADSAAMAAAVVTGGLGDYSVDDNLLIFCGDSTTEQMGGAGYGFDRITSQHRRSAGRLRNIIGTINFGGSGNTLSNFVNSSASTPPEIQSTVNAGVGSWDYYGHKPTGAISLLQATAWRAGKADKCLWVICFGINDCILNAAIGNLSQQGISEHLAPLLEASVRSIIAEFPDDRVVLRIPNPMTARPYNPAAGFPSPSQYPSFGADLAADQALVDKWNNGIRGAYLSVQNRLPKTVVWDTWTRVFGASATSRVVAETPYLGDLVHPSGAGYIRMADDFVDFIAPEQNGTVARHVEAELRAAVVGGDAVSIYPGYLSNNPKYKLCAKSRDWVGVGANYIDIGLSLGDFLATVDASKPLYISVGDVAAQKFATYGAVASGTNTRLTGIVVSSAMQGAIGDVSVYQDSLSTKSSDTYIASQLLALKPRDIFIGNIGSAGNGYIDISFNPSESRLSTKWKVGLSAGRLIVGGGASASVSLAGSTVNRAGTTAQRAVRVLLAGDHSAYANKVCAVVFDDSAPTPRIHEHGAVTQRAVAPHAQGSRGFVHCPYEMLDGATLRAYLTEPIAQSVVVDVYAHAWPARTHIGAITIAANASVANMASGNPTFVAAGAIYEFVVSSATSHATGLVGLAVVPA